MESLAILICGLLPAIVFGMLGYRWLYKYTRLPASKAILAVMLGIVSAIPAFYIESAIESSFDVELTNIWHAFFIAFIMVALVEEVFKVVMLYLSAYVVPVDEPMDFLAISVLIAMGFAGIENILYSHNLGWEVALFRSLTAVPAHACFAMLMAYVIAMNYPLRKKVVPYAQGLLLAWFIHGCYDFFILQELSEPLMLGAIVILLLGAMLSWNVYKRVRQLDR